MAASTELNTILRDAAKRPLLRMTLSVVASGHVDTPALGHDGPDAKAPLARLIQLTCRQRAPKTRHQSSRSARKRGIQGEIRWVMSIFAMPSGPRSAASAVRWPRYAPTIWARPRSR